MKWEGIVGFHLVRLSILYVCNISCLGYNLLMHLNALQSNLVQMLFSLKRSAVTLTWVHTSKVKVTQYI